MSMTADQRLIPDGDGPRWFGVYPAIVTDIMDPDNKGRIQLKFPT